MEGKYPTPKADKLVANGRGGQRPKAKLWTKDLEPLRILLQDPTLKFTVHGER